MTRQEAIAKIKHHKQVIIACNKNISTLEKRIKNNPQDEKLSTWTAGVDANVYERAKAGGEVKALAERFYLTKDEVGIL